MRKWFISLNYYGILMVEVRKCKYVILVIQTLNYYPILMVEVRKLKVCYLGHTYSKLLPHTYDGSCLTMGSIIYLITDNV